jgi:Tol biopolymer transport system component
VPIDEVSGMPTAAPEPISLPAGNSGHFSISKQGDLAYIAMTRGYRLLAMSFDPKSGTTGPPRPLFGTSQVIVWFHPSPDQQSIAFDTLSGGSESVFIASGDGTHLRRLTVDAKDRAVNWSPDGKTLYFSSNREGPYQIWSIHEDGSGLTRITADADLKRHGIQDIYLADVSPDGRTLSAWTDHGIVLVHLDRPITDRVETLGFNMDLPRFSPDGSQLVGHDTPRVGASEIDLYSIPVRSRQKILDHGNTPMWLPDGKHIVYFERQSICILDLNSHQTTTAPFNPFPQSRSDSDAFQPYLSTDGKTLYVGQPIEQGNVWMVRFQK